MPKVTLSSDSDRQTVIFGGVPPLLAGVPITVTHQQVNAIQTIMAGWDDSLRKSVRLHWELDQPIVTETQTVVPTVPVAIAPPPAVEEPFELTDEDQDLIEVEISKILGLTNAEAEPIVIKTGGSEDLPRGIRVAYLEALIAHANVKKGVKEVAEKLLEQI